jgi:hypothetical protein
MNIFVLDEDPIVAAKMYCDKHIPKMCVELLQQLGSAAIRHGATPDIMPLTKKGTPLKGGYHNHPCSIWVSMSRDNYLWAAHHGAALCEEYTKRFGKEHFCSIGIEVLYGLSHLIPEGGLTPFALAMPDEFRPHLNEHIGAPFDLVPNDDFTFISHASGDDAVQAYRRYYHSKAFAKWEKGRPMPDWFSLEEQAVLA